MVISTHTKRLNGHQSLKLQNLLTCASAPCRLRELRRSRWRWSNGYALVPLTGLGASREVSKSVYRLSRKLTCPERGGTPHLLPLGRLTDTTAAAAKAAKPTPSAAYPPQASSRPPAAPPIAAPRL